ncbi:MAG: peptide deformylase [Bdellovibrionales bacterium]|nr:peptide deformylase [Bdellovibrionales bacterium]
MKSKPVSKDELQRNYVQRFLDDLVDTCIAANGAGIAAPQVGINRQIIIVNLEKPNSRYPDREGYPTTIAINPVVKHMSKNLSSDWEGDLSFGLRGLVPRPESCEIHFWDRQGRDRKIKLSGFVARVFQHEIDHLHGILLIDRVKHKETICEVSEWQKYWGDRKSLPEPIGDPYKFPEEL